MKPSLNLLDRESADLYALVLISQGIAVAVEEQDEYFNLAVPPELHEEALGILKLFYWENLASAVTIREERVPRKPFGPICAALVLLSIHWVIYFKGWEREMVLEYGSSALYILQGEFYRVVTALFLHANLEHLLGNLAGLLIFGIPVCTRAGTWPGLLMLLFSGISGNLATAHIYRTAHLSIGASTSVMGAAGILTSFQMVKKAGSSKTDLKMLLPLGAGAALVGMLSGGENTDIMAHLLGFVSGLVLGACFSLAYGRKKPSMVHDLVAFFLLFTVLGLSIMKRL